MKFKALLKKGAALALAVMLAAGSVSAGSAAEVFGAQIETDESVKGTSAMTLTVSGATSGAVADKGSVAIKGGATETFTISSTGGLNTTTIRCESSAPEIATITKKDGNDWELAGIKRGKATVTITVTDSASVTKTQTFEVEVTDELVTAITATYARADKSNASTSANDGSTDQKGLLIKLNGLDHTITATPALTPSTATQKIENITWETDSANIATVVKNADGTGTVTGHSAGTAKITMSIPAAPGAGATIKKDFYVTVQGEPSDDMKAYPVNEDGTLGSASTTLAVATGESLNYMIVFKAAGTAGELPSEKELVDKTAEADKEYVDVKIGTYQIKGDTAKEIHVPITVTGKKPKISSGSATAVSVVLELKKLNGASATANKDQITLATTVDHVAVASIKVKDEAEVDVSGKTMKLSVGNDYSFNVALAGTSPTDVTTVKPTAIEWCVLEKGTYADAAAVAAAVAAGTASDIATVTKNAQTGAITVTGAKAGEATIAGVVVDVPEGDPGDKVKVTFDVAVELAYLDSISITSPANEVEAESSLTLDSVLTGVDGAKPSTAKSMVKWQIKSGEEFASLKDNGDGTATITGKAAGTVTVIASAPTIPGTDAVKTAEYTLTIKDKPAQPDTEDPSRPGEDPSKPGTDPSKPGEDPSKPGEDPSKPGNDPSKPGEDPSRPGTTVAAQSVTLNKKTLVVVKGKKATLKATVTPENAADKTVTWSSSNNKVAKVDAKGVVTGVKGGTATITAKTANGKSASCKVTVATVTLNAKTLKIQKGKTTTALKVKSTTVKKDTVKSWSSSNKKVATVTKNGKIKAVKTGTTTITVKMKSGATASCKLTVQKKAVTATSVSLNKKKLTLKKGKSATLQLTVKPLTATDVKWTSSNPSVATVSKSGKVTAKKAGTTTITVTTSKGKKATCKVTVKK